MSKYIEIYNKFLECTIPRWGLKITEMIMYNWKTVRPEIAQFGRQLTRDKGPGFESWCSPSFFFTLLHLVHLPTPGTDRLTPTRVKNQGCWFWRIKIIKGEEMWLQDHFYCKHQVAQLLKHVTRDSKGGRGWFKFWSSPSLFTPSCVYSMKINLPGNVYI